MPQIPQQAEGQPASSDTDFSDEKMFTGNMALNRRNIRYLKDLSVADVDPASLSLPNLRKKANGPRDGGQQQPEMSDCVFVGAGETSQSPQFMRTFCGSMWSLGPEDATISGRQLCLLTGFSVDPHHPTTQEF